MTRSDWEKLVATFMPKVELSRTSPYKDEYMPSSIDWYLKRAIMLDREDGAFRIEHPTRQDLQNNPEPSRYLKPENESVYSGDSSTAVMYVHVRRATDPAGVADKDWIDIQYWFFYPYNGGIGGLIYPMFPGGTHEGDWEHVTVRVSNWRDLSASAVEAVFFAAHGRAEGKWLVKSGNSPRSGRYTLVDGKHPLVYSAYHSHASYENDGLHWRKLTYYFANDYCSGGRTWGPDAGFEIMAIDEDVYASGDERIEVPGWIAFSGRWGSDGSPRTPTQQPTWADDGSNGFYVNLEVLANLGDDWGNSRGTTAVALGWLGERSVLAVARNKGDHSRYYLYDYADGKLEQLASGGDSWGDSRGATGIALGIFADHQMLGVSRSSGDHSRFQLLRWSDDKLVEFASGGDSWGSSRGASAIAFGTFAGKQVVGVGRDAGNHERFYIYEWKDEKLAVLASGGSEWSDSRGTTAIAFGRLDDRQVVGVGRNKGNHERFDIYEWRNGELALLSSGGGSWSDDREVTSIAFGVLDGSEVVGVTRDAGDNGRFFIYRRTNGALELLVEGGKDWGSSRGATGIAFGLINGESYVAVSRTGDSGLRVILYQYVDGELLERGTVGDSWGNGRDATCVAIGMLAEMPVIAYGRNQGDHSRGGVLNWTVK